MLAVKVMELFYYKNPKWSTLSSSLFYEQKNYRHRKKYSSYKLEVTVIIEALRKFRAYLQGIPFKIVTHISAFQKTMEKQDLATPVAHWALLFQEFNYVLITCLNSHKETIMK